MIRMIRADRLECQSSILEPAPAQELKPEIEAPIIQWFDRNDLGRNGFRGRIDVR